MRHLVLLRLKPDTPKTTVEEFLAAAAQLPRKIPGILSYEVGRDLGLPAPGLNAEIAITGNFESESAYETYAKHPEHVAAVGIIKPFLAENGGRTATQIRSKI